jgi:two-component system CheB/CheR fusion protein
VVGIGASAGGLEALERFFSGISGAPGVAFVVLQHLEPGHESSLPALLRERTSLEVRSLRGKTPAEANCIYVVPAGVRLGMRSCVLHPRPAAAAAGRRQLIDHFFLALAEDQGDEAVAVVLSGTGSDGTQGVRAVKERGGLVLAQAPETARYGSMPRSAILTGLVDHVLAPEMMGEAIVPHVERVLEARRLDETDGMVEHTAAALDEICSLLRAVSGHDFSRYRLSTLTRRIRRRMQLAGLETFDESGAGRRAAPAAAAALQQDLLIRVTRFRRDPESFAALARLVLPKLVEGRREGDAVRVWVPACSTGYEAQRRDSALRIQIYATEVDVHGL